jgi:hypothetical protein
MVDESEIEETRELWTLSCIAHQKGKTQIGLTDVKLRNKKGKNGFVKNVLTVGQEIEILEN